MHYKTLASVLLLALSPAFAFCADNPPLLPRITIEGNQLVVAGKPIYMSGANTPWNLWNDFGKSSFNPDWWDNHYSQFNANGLNSSRVWITCSGEVGINIDSNGYVSGATDKHWSDLDQLFQIAQARGVYIMATLLSFDHFVTHYTTWQRWRNWINSDANVDSYIANYLIPFVQRYGNNTALWSIDLINEPDWATTDEGGAIEWSRFQRFFAKASKAIHDNSPTLVTVGIAVIKYNSDVGWMKNVVSDSALRAQIDAPEATLDFWSTHWYPWMEPYWGIPMYVTPSGFDLDATKPSVLGECPASGSGDTLAGDFESAYQNGWSGIMPWTSNGVDNNGGWTEVSAASNAFVTNHREAVFPNTDTHPAPHPMPVISRGVPSFSSMGTASQANNSSYGDYLGMWSEQWPKWLAYDLSGVPEEQRSVVLLAWYNDSYPYFESVIRAPGDYTIEGNAAAGGTLPNEGWVVLHTEESNIFHSRQHVVGMTGYNWIRLHVTSSEGTSQNLIFNMDIHDAHLGAEDSWIFFGDSITAGGMGQAERGGQNFAQIVNAANPAYFPSQENAGRGAWTTDNMVSTTEERPVSYINQWLANFPGRYVTLNFGTNDSSGLGLPDQTRVQLFYSNYEMMVQAVLAAGKIPVIPTIPWANDSRSTQNIPALNAQLEILKSQYPEIIDGPDFWTFFLEHPEMLADALHPSDAGYLEYRRLWAEKMLEVVYSGSAPNPENHAPVLDTIGDQSAQAGQPIQITIQATDEDENPLTYSASGAP